MQITYFGENGFVLKGQDATVALACPLEKTNDVDIIITATTDEKVKANDNQAVFDWPGEYESKKVSVMLAPVGKDKKTRIAKVILDNIAFAHIDNLTEPLTEAEEEKLGNIDVLFVNISEQETRKVVEVVGPRLVIPMNFAAGEQIDFAKSLGFGEIEEKDVLKLKKSNLPNDRMEFAVIRQQN